MTRNKSFDTKPRSPSSAPAGRSDKRPGEASSDAGTHHHLPSPAAIRETIESVAIAFILAFLFRTFEAEAFVIPTGSMAPTLMGRHKDVVCKKCGCPYQVSASEEVMPDGAPRGRESEIEAGTCPMCRYTDTTMLEKDPSYNGDRILVSKFAYQIAEPKRWDVIVFKYPGDPPTVPAYERTDSRINFIKRLVGLPGETIRIQDGDIWVLPPEEAGKNAHDRQFAIARKRPEKLLAMLQLVFDNDYMPRIAKDGWPARWYAPEPMSPDGKAAGTWRTDDSTTFSLDGTAGDLRWLRYHHRVPSYEQWQEAADRPTPVPPQLITDFTAYDTGKKRSDGSPAPGPPGIGQHWVGDLAVECTVDVESPSGALAFELCKGRRRFQCRFDLANGRATLSINGQDMQAWKPAATTAVKGKGRHKILFSNCDDELRLWVDGGVVSFDAPTTYDDLHNTRPDAADLEPVGVAAAGASVRLSHLRVLRDIYYIADRWDTGKHDPVYPLGGALPGKEMFPSRPSDNVMEPPKPVPPYVDFSLKEDQFFVLGDNSAMSKDGRLWGEDRYWVPRSLLIGKALFIYWPHSWERIPYVNIPFPYFPNFSRMGLVR